MKLLGAATSGVSPQTGSYLSKEDRIAMFKNATGRRGYAGRSSGGGEGKGDEGENVRVQATSAIVAVNTMTTTIQKLQVTNQDTIEEVRVQVEKNRESIEDLFSKVAVEKEQQLLTEKAESRQERRSLELGLRAGAEGMLEGLGKAVAKTTSALSGAANKALTPVKGMIDKLFELLGLLGAAWAIDNLPAIVAAIDNFTSSIPTLGDALNGAINFLTGTRGVFSILDRMFQPLKSFIGKILRKAIDVTNWIVRKGADLIGTIFRKITSFVVEFFKTIVRRAADLLSNIPIPGRQGADAAETAAKSTDEVVDAGRAATGSADEVVDAGKGAKQGLDAADTAKDGLKNRNIFQRLSDWGKSQFDKLSSGGKSAMNWMGKQMEGGKNMLTGLADRVKFAGDTSAIGPRQKATWLENMLSPIARMFGGKGGAKFLKGLVGVLERIPGIGMLIDIAINKGLDGMSWTESIIRGMSSGAGGAVGALAGAKAGGLAGAAIGTVVPGIGNIIGGVVGAAIGGFLGAAAAGAFGDEVGKVAYKNATGKEPTQNDVMFDKAANKSMQFLGDSFGFEVQEDESTEEPRTTVDVSGQLSKLTGDTVMQAKIPATNISSVFSSDSAVPSAKLSTPDGMQLSPESKNADESSLMITELPPNVYDMGLGAEAEPSFEPPKGTAQAIPSFETTDPTTDDYRTLAQLAFEVAA